MASLRRRGPIIVSCCDHNNLCGGDSCVAMEAILVEHIEWNHHCKFSVIALINQ